MEIELKPQTKLELFKDALESISGLTGEDFFRELVKTISEALQVDGVWVTQYHKEQNSMTTLAFWHGNNFVTNFTYLIDGTPCQKVIDSPTPLHYSNTVRELFPKAHKMMDKFGGNSYAGTSLLDDNGEVIGSLAILSDQTVPSKENVQEIIKTVKSRAESELQRLKREREMITREYQLRGLINGVQDLLINLNHAGQIVMMNATAESVLAVNEAKSGKHYIAQFLTDESKSKLLTLIEKLNSAPFEQKYVWIPDALEIIPNTGDPLRVEGTLSQYELDEKKFYTLVVRNQDDRSKSHENIKQLIDETRYLQEELEDIKHSNQLIGESNTIKRLLQNIYMVAHTDATVLITGETGTGKELVARHIHTTSNRKDKPMVCVNCGAIPPSLIESEFFGHAKGAFTGATAERKGRFQMADGGTIFLDEIGELPLDLQVKLLRVIQEGEVEPVGSSKTIKVDVRIIAATHRNLFQLTKENKFREDLYYRLNVFPIEVPPLRERENDVVLLANTFINRYAKRFNKKFEPLSEAQKQLLRSYSWPGNIRELQNIVERSVILARDGQIDLTSTLAFVEVKNEEKNTDEDDDRILTKDELIEFEKRNIIKALKAANWKVSGRDGAASLLKMVPSTLSSRIAALGIKIPND